MLNSRMNEILGLPIHPLLVHAPIIAVPTFAVAAICYAVIRPIRHTIGWVVMSLSVIAPLSVLGGWWSGHQFYDFHIDMINKAGVPTSKFENLLADHLKYGDILIWLVPALAVVIWAFGGLNRRSQQAVETDTPEDPPANTARPTGPRLIMIVLAVAIVGLSVASGGAYSNQGTVALKWCGTEKSNCGAMLMAGSAHPLIQQEPGDRDRCRCPQRSSRTTQ